MTDQEVRDIVKDVDRLGMDDIEKAMEIRSRGVTVAEYRRFERKKTVRFVAVCMIWTTLWWAACWGASRVFVMQAEQRENGKE